MKPTRPPKRSVSPFGGILLTEEREDNAAPFETHFSTTGRTCPPTFEFLEDAGFLPQIVEELKDAPANDAPELPGFCDALVKYRVDFESRGLLEPLFELMLGLFDRKTDIFLIDHYSKEACEKMNWPDPFRDVVLFSKERDLIVGRFFGPITESNPGRFSTFLSRWISSESVETLLHFLDFARGSKNPTFEHYLLFAHPAFQRILRGKSQMKGLFTRVEPFLTKISSPTWPETIKKELGLSS